MAGLVSPKEDGRDVAVDEGSICAAGTGFTNASRQGETEGERQHTDWAEFVDESSMVAGAVPQESIGDVESKGKLLSEPQMGSHWITNRDSLPSDTNNTCDWASFSPVATSRSMDTSHWAQNTTNCTANNGENPVINSDYKHPDMRTEVGDGSPGWQEFSLSGSYGTPNSWFETVQSDRDSVSYAESADCTHHPILQTRRADDPCQMHTSDLCTALPHHRHHHHHQCVAVFRQCFTSSSLQDTMSGGVGDSVPQMVSIEYVQDWQQIRDTSFARVLWNWAQTSLHHPPPSSCQTRLTAVLGMAAGDEESGHHATGSLLPPGEEEKFDWTHPNQRRRSVSPEVVPNLFRPRKESLIDVDFDHNRAASGLSVLSEVELQQMCDEMASKFSRLSEELLTNLQQRDVLAGEMEAKNRFVSALLRVQQLRHSQDLNGGFGEVGRGRQWVWSQKKRDDEPTGMYLQTVIPYKCPDGLRWKTDTLIQLTKVLKAIAEGSSTVPKLMAEYLQSEFLASPVADHPFEDSIPPDKNHELSALSV